MLFMFIELVDWWFRILYVSGINNIQSNLKHEPTCMIQDVIDSFNTIVAQVLQTLKQSLSKKKISTIDVQNKSAGFSKV